MPKGEYEEYCYQCKKVKRFKLVRDLHGHNLVGIDCPHDVYPPWLETLDDAMEADSRADQFLSGRPTKPINPDDLLLP